MYATVLNIYILALHFGIQNSWGIYTLKQVLMHHIHVESRVNIGYRKV
jgi:hypothetical protein